MKKTNQLSKYWQQIQNFQKDKEDLSTLTTTLQVIEKTLNLQ